MSLELARSVDREFPQLLRANVGSTCHRYTLVLIDRLRTAGHQAYLMGKTQGEGQYVPPGFVPQIVKGLDGTDYRITGVSHDAIWCDGQQFDTIGGANDSETPLIENGRQLVGIPVWNAIPRQFWRPNNPPLTDTDPGAPPPPQPAPAPSFPYPDENTAGKAFQLRVQQAYRDAGRLFPDPNDRDAFRHFMRFGYSAHEMDAAKAADKHIAELRKDLGL